MDADDLDLDMGELIMPTPRKLGGATPKQPALLHPWFVPKGKKRPATDTPECTGQRHSNASGKLPIQETPKPTKPLTPEEAEKRRVDRDHVATVARELDAIRGHIFQREEENNAAFDKREYPEWRLVPPGRLPAVAVTAIAPASIPNSPPREEDVFAPAPVPARAPTGPPGRDLATGKKLALHRLLSCEDDEMKKHGAVLVTYAAFVRASNEKVDLTLLGHVDDDGYSMSFKISKSNRESVTFQYAAKNLKELITAVPAFNGDHKLTGMQRLSTALMTTGYDKSVHLMVKAKSTIGCDACYLLPPHEQTDIIINNLTVASGKTRATIFCTMRHVATAEAFAKTQASFTQYRLIGHRQRGSGLHATPFIDAVQTKMARVVIALVPAPVLQQWVDASQKLATTFGNDAWITWCGLASTTTGGGRGSKKVPKTTKPKTLPEAIKLTEERKCSLFWVLEANTKSSAAALFTAPEYALPYRIIDEGTGSHLTEPRTTKKQSICRYTVICNATLEQLKDHTNQQPKHPLRRAMDGRNMDLSSSRHCAIATLCSLPSWLRLVTGLSMAPLMPQGILKICMRVQVKSLAGTLNKGSDMVLTSTDDLIQGLILDNSSAMTSGEKTELTNKCRSILNRADPSVSIADNLKQAIADVQADEDSLLPMPTPEVEGGRLTTEQIIVADGLKRYKRVYSTMRRLFANLLTALCPDPPPECPITLDAIEPENVCILSCCTTLIDKQCLEHITNKRCPMCRAPITGVASASQAADALSASKPKAPEPEQAAPPTLKLRAGDTDGLVEAFRNAAGTKCNSSLEAVVKSLEVALKFKPKGLRVLLCCNVWGGARTYNASLDEEKNTHRTCEFLRKALPALTSVGTIGKGPKSKLPEYKAFDNKNHVFIIDTSARSTTMAGLDLPETDIILFDRLGNGGSIDTAKIVQSIGRAIRVQKKGLDENKADHAHFREHGRSRHAPKLVVFIDKYKAAVHATATA